MYTSVNGYNVLEKLGESPLATVLKGEDRHLKRPVALKLFKAQHEVLGRTEIDEFALREARLRIELPANARIPAVYGFFEYESTPADTKYAWTLAMQYIQGINLREHIDGLRDKYSGGGNWFESLQKSGVAEARKAIDYDAFVSHELLKIVDWFIEIAKTIQYMHEMREVHLDIKPENVLVDGKGEI